MTTTSNQNRPSNNNLDFSGIDLTPIIVFGLVILGGGVLISFLTPVLLPEQASAQAQATDGLFRVLLAIGGAVFLLVQGLLVYSVIRFRAQPGDTGDGPPMHGNMTLEIVWTIIPAIIVFFLAIISFFVWTGNTAPREMENIVNGEAIEIDAVGQRYLWRFDYFTNAQTLEGEPIVVSSDQLHTYIGQNIRLDMYTQDVIHSFWVPAMRVKQDLLPGRETQVRFTPIETADGYEYLGVVGPATIYAEADTNSEIVRELAATERLQIQVSDTNYGDGGDWVRLTFSNGDSGFVSADAIGGQYNRYRLICTELCGGGHGEMYSWLIVHESEEAFLNNFYTPEVAQRVAPPSDPVAAAPLVLGEYPCAGCHVLDSLGWSGITGPALNGIGDRAGDRVSGLNGVEYLLQSLHLPNEYIVPGYAAGQMPYFGMSEEAPPGHQPYNIMPEEDLVAIVAYLCTQVGSGNVADSDCQVDLTDPEATIDYIESQNEQYVPLYGG